MWNGPEDFFPEHQYQIGQFRVYRPRHKIVRIVSLMGLMRDPSTAEVVDFGDDRDSAWVRTHVADLGPVLSEMEVIAFMALE